MDSDLLATCNALGYLEEERYFKEPDCLDTVKCLIKYLHTEDNNHDIRIQLGSGHILRNDLLPIIRQYPDDDALCAAVLRLLVNLTQPALLCFGNKVPTQVDQYHNYLDILSHNQSYKEDFSSEETWKVLAQKVYDILEKDWEDRTPDDSMTVERILVLCRNILHVPKTDEDEKQVSDNNSTHDKLIMAMHYAGIDSMILYLASSDTEQQWCLHVAEIIALLLKEQTPGDLAGLDNQAERAREGDELKSMRLQEDRRKQMKVLHQSSRHSRFGGTFVAKGMTALTDTNDLVLHKSLQKCNNVTYDEGKNRLRKAKNKRPLVDTSMKRRTTYEVRRVLKEFCGGLLENGYNHFMFSIRDKISRESSDEHDETYYFTIMSFMMEFNRKHKFHVDQISETLQLATLHFIDVSIVNFMELMMTDKEECKTWGKRMHLALRCYKEFLVTVQMMQASKNEGFVESAKVLLNNIFYTSEYRDVFLTLLRKYDESKLSHAFLDNLIQTTHLFVRLFEKYCKGNSVVVEKKNKRTKKRKKRNNQNAGSEVAALTEEEKQNVWNDIVDSVAESTQQSDLPDPGPSSAIFDPTSDVSEEQQQQKALVKLQRIILSKCAPESVVFLRQARDLWPEIDIFGTSDATWEDDVTTLKEICLADVSGLPDDNPANQEEEEEVEEEEQVFVSRKEVEFNFNDFLRKFADSKVIQPYVILLAKFESNSQQTNHCVVKLLHRVAFDLKMYGILFQASVFRCFQKIFKCSKLNPSLKELAGFGKFVMQKFFEVLPRNDKLFAEILFWKLSATNVYELTEGYGSLAKTQGSKTITWSEAEQTELAQLYEEFKDGDLDIVDCILARITDESRTRKQVVRQLLNQEIVQDPAQLKRKKGSRPTIWREQDETELRSLFEEFRNSEDPLGNIIQMMSTKRSKPKLIEKILSLDLVRDRKELYKRKKKGDSSRQRKQGETEIIHAGGSDSESDKGEERQSESDDDDSWELIDLQACVRKATQGGFAEQISWVKTNLEQAIEDRNQSSPGDEEQDLPLVPLTEEQEDAMQNSAFRKMLHFIGLNKPSTGQEMFWRIPTQVSSERLEESVEALSRPVEMTKSSPKLLERPEEVLELVRNVEGTSGVKRKRSADSKEEDGKGNTEQTDDIENSLDNKAKRRKRISMLAESDSEQEESGGSSGQEQGSPSLTTPRRLIMDDSDEEEKHDTLNEPPLSDPIWGQESPSLKNHRRLILDDSDDEDEEVEDADKENRKIQEVESEPVKGQGLDEDLELPSRKNRKRFAVIADDDDD